MELNYIKKDYLIEKLSKRFLKIGGFEVSEDYRMQISDNPRAINCVAMAIIAIEEFQTFVEGELEEDEDVDVEDDEEDEETSPISRREYLSRLPSMFVKEEFVKEEDL